MNTKRIALLLTAIVLALAPLSALADYAFETIQDALKQSEYIGSPTLTLPASGTAKDTVFKLDLEKDEICLTGVNASGKRVSVYWTVEFPYSVAAFYAICSNYSSFKMLTLYDLTLSLRLDSESTLTVTNATQADLLADTLMNALK